MASSAAPSQLGARGLRLFAGILRAHRALPQQMRALGDAYVREEFRKHRDAKAKFLPAFFREWDAYLAQLAAAAPALGGGGGGGAAGGGGAGAGIGRDLAPDEAAALTKEQLEQLARLHEEATKLAR